MRPKVTAPARASARQRLECTAYDGAVLMPLTVVLFGLLGALAAYVGYLTLRGRPMDDPTLYLALATEVVLLVQLVVGIIRAGDGAASMSRPVFIAYLVGLIFVLPAAGAWAIAERTTRWGTGVLLVGVLGLLVMVVRLVQLWNGAG